MAIGKKKRARATVDVTFHLQQVDDCIEAQSSMGRTALESVARAIYITYRELTNASHKQQVLGRLSDFAVAKREEALAAGASDLTDPLWNCSSLIESIASVELKSLQGMDSLDGASRVRRQMKIFMDQYLSDTARIELDAYKEIPFRHVH